MDSLKFTNYRNEIQNEIFVLYSMKTGFTNQNLIQAEEKLLYEVQGVVFARRGVAESGKDNPEDLVL